MTPQQAIAVVEVHRKELRIRKAMEPVSTERSIVRYKANLESPGPAEDRIAWIVTLSCSLGAVRVDVDDATGQVLSVQRTA